MSQSVNVASEVEALLINIRNARQVWGEGSAQHQACKALAREYVLQLNDAGAIARGATEGTAKQSRSDEGAQLVATKLQSLNLSSPSSCGSR